MRLFIAIRLTDELQSVLAETMHLLKKAGVKGSYAPKQNLHLTLAFLGEVQDPEAVREVLGRIKYKPFRLSFSETGAFGDIVWAGVKGNQGLAAAVKDIRAALDDAGIGYDRKKFVPHITLIRKAAGKWQAVPAPKGDMMVKSISLMKSDVRDGKRVYTELKKR